MLNGDHPAARTFLLTLPSTVTKLRILSCTWCILQTYLHCPETLLRCSTYNSVWMWINFKPRIQSYNTQRTLVKRTREFHTCPGAPHSLFSISSARTKSLRWKACNSSILLNMVDKSFFVHPVNGKRLVMSETTVPPRLALWITSHLLPKSSLWEELRRDSWHTCAHLPTFSEHNMSIGDTIHMKTITTLSKFLRTSDSIASRGESSPLSIIEPSPSLHT